MGMPRLNAQDSSSEATPPTSCRANTCKSMPKSCKTSIAESEVLLCKFHAPSCNKLVCNPSWGEEAHLQQIVIPFLGSLTEVKVMPSAVMRNCNPHQLRFVLAKGGPNPTTHSHRWLHPSPTTGCPQQHRRAWCHTGALLKDHPPAPHRLKTLLPPKKTHQGCHVQAAICQTEAD